MKKSQSFFKFEITQTTSFLVYMMKMGDGKRWTLIADTPQRMTLLEIDNPENKTEVRLLPNVLHFTTVRGFVYVVEDKKSNGAVVSFNGPVNALLMQFLMPRMTYVPQTLVGMSSDMPNFAPISEFMKQREMRHNGQVNPQDKHGWRVNMKFNNELAPWFPPFHGEFRNLPFKKKTDGKFVG